MNRPRVVVVGIFLVGGFLLFAGGLFLIGERRLLFERQFELYSEFGKVTGLQVGSQVRVAGLQAGEVLAIQIPSRPSEQFRVLMRLRDDVRQLVRMDSSVAMQTDGIVGNTFLQIGRGSDASPVVSPGDTIRGIDPIEFSDLIQEGRETFRTVSVTLLDLKDSMEEAIAPLGEVAEEATGLIKNVGDELKTMTQAGTAAIEEARSAMTTGQRLLEQVQAGHGSVGKLLTDDALYEHIVGIGAETQQALHNLRETTDRGRELMTNFAAPDGPARQIAQGLRAAIVQTQEMMSDLAETTEALKRNFLFRGFFRERGFYDLDAISHESYLAGALEGKDRTALRVWLDASMLFTRNTDGEESLSDAGKQRLDSAMADLIRYPRDSPLVVEGYAESRAGETPYLESADRAMLVRDYLVSRFRLKTTLVDFIGLSDQAPRSPSGDGRWSGVALTLFVRGDALARLRETASER